jgi:hypothetical protein
VAIRIKIIPRPQFAGYLSRSARWSCLVVHRRGGKTFCCVQDLIARSLTHSRPGPPLRYAYLAPTRDQAKDIAWGYLTEFTSRIPGVEINKADLQVTLPNKAVIRLYSGEAYERMRGLYFDGVVIDEYADIDPNAWDSVIRPCLTDYQGWATFIGTPKGKNAFWRVHLRSLEESGWFSLVLRASESGIIDPGELEDIRKGTPEPVYRQEMECDFSIGRPGAIYSRAIEAARQSKRVTNDVLWFKELPVYTAWDVGAPHNQKVWIFQPCGDRINFLESLSGDQECATPADWASRLKAKQYAYGGHFLPHDACSEVGGLWQDGLNRAGLTGIVPVPRQVSVWDGINLAVDALPRCFFNLDGCADGLDSLDAYHSKEERDGVTIKDIPVHDWASHYSDSFSLAHQAIQKGLVRDRSAIPRRPADSRRRPVVISGVNGQRNVVRC